MKPTRRRMLITGAVIFAAVLVTGAMLIFKPWLLLVDVRVDDAIPTVAPPVAEAPVMPLPATPQTGPPPAGLPDAAPTGPTQLSGGTFISHEHSTTGSARIIQQPDGTRVLALEDLDTTTGPDVHVWLSAADVVEGRDGWFTAGSAEHVDLGALKGNQGNQLYSIPADIDLSRYKAVDLWCVQFAVSFGAAQLSAP